MPRRLDDVELCALMVDGVQIGDHSVVVALGIKPSGEKLPLGLEVGSTENAALCTALLQNTLERGLKIDGRVLCVIDGGQGLKMAGLGRSPRLAVGSHLPDALARYRLAIG